MKKTNLTILNIIFLLIICGCSRSSVPIHPTDDSLIQIFNENKEDFVFLLNQFRSKNLREIRLESLISSNPKGQEKKFYETMNEIGISYIHIRGQKRPQIEFTVSSSGWATGGSGKGYVYIENEEKRYFIDKHQTVESLDDYFDNNRDFTKYRKLSKLWYLFCEHDG